MKQKILFWLGRDFIHFGLANNLKKYDEFDYFAIVDVNEKIKDFFLKQKIVDFKKIWFFNDYELEKPDLEYLKNFEDRYKINLWYVIFTERLFYKKWNRFYEFSTEQILSIIERECRFFENILEEVKPDFFLTNIITQHQTYLLYKMCQTKGIPVLALSTVRFGDRAIVTEGLVWESNIEKNFEPKKFPQKTPEEIKEFIKNYKPRKFYETVGSEFSSYKISSTKKIKAFFKFLFLPKKSSTQYVNFGRTKWNILMKGTRVGNIINRRIRESRLNKKFIRHINKNEKFIYFPLHVEPETVLLFGAPYYTDQIAMIRNIAKSIPFQYKLYVKDHPAMWEVGWREKSFYDELENMPNVSLIHPSIRTEEIIKFSSLVITIRGTASLEAAFYNKPSILMRSDMGQSLIPSISILKNLEELPMIINEALNKKVTIEGLSDYLNFIQQISFEFPNEHLSYEVARRFNYTIGYLNQETITELMVESFLKDYQEIFDNVTKAYLKKMKSENYVSSKI